MEVPEPIVVKAVTNEEYFGEPGVLRAIVTAFVPYIIGQIERDVLFIHRKDPEATTSIAIEIRAEGSLADQELAQRTVERLMGLDKLSYRVTFATIVEREQLSFESAVASLEAQLSLDMYLGGVNLQLAAEQESRRRAEHNEQHLFDHLGHLPMPWEVQPGSVQDTEMRFVVDMLMGIMSGRLDP